MGIEKPTLSEMSDDRERASWHAYEKFMVRYTLDHYRKHVDERREQLTAEISDWKRLRDNPLTLPRKQAEYQRLIDEATSFLGRLDHALEKFDDVSEVREVETEDGTFRLVYEAHVLAHSPKVLDGLDAYAFEVFSETPESGDPVSYVADTGSGPFWFGDGTYDADAPVFDALRESRLPAFKCDVSGATLKEASDTEMRMVSIAEGSLALGMLASGGYLAADAAKEASRKPEKGNGMSRRDFLGLIGKAGVGAALFGGGSMSALEKMVPSNDIPSASTVSGWYLRLRDDILSSLGAYRITAEFRNLVMAQKLHTIAGHMRQEVPEGEKPHVGMELGKNHYGIEETLRMTEAERLARMIDVLKRTGIELESPEEEVASVIRYDYIGDVWKSTRFVDPAISEAFRKHPSRTAVPTGVSPGSAPVLE
ncbi:MAG: hypothetical protein HGA38_02625 [Candidatus Moranbacteria bacterium]|nr:hypothetical protein [Candidatus Moranbacteria bacterium]NTW46368.1 hypothetical protein [Candidatus Moranbacteria bacterium]